MNGGLCELMGRKKFIIGGVHLLALPGTTGYDEAGGVNGIIAAAREDAEKLQRGGVDAILFANEADLPYSQVLGPEAVAAYCRVVCEVTRALEVPFGINVLLDPVAAIAIAHATGGAFVRGFYTGTYVGDLPLMDSRGGEALRLRHALRADHIQVIANVTCAMGTNLDVRDVATRVRGAVMHSRVDAFSVSGAAAGCEAPYREVEETVRAAHDLPVLIGTGCTQENIGRFLRLADGAIVATALREGGKTLARVDSARVEAFMCAVAACRAMLEADDSP